MVLYDVVYNVTAWFGVEASDFFASSMVLKFWM
jgi:hypothetical protein